jgi:hypothetical protein
MGLPHFVRVSNVLTFLSSFARLDREKLIVKRSNKQTERDADNDNPLRLKRCLKNYSFILGAIAIAFFARVAGQALVAFLDVKFLPPMKEWYSGLLPYPLLLPVQIAILAFQFEVSRQLWIGAGPLTQPRPRLGIGLKWFSLIYFLGMLARYIITMALFPERRWFGGAIPIVFHWVLAAYLYLLSRCYRRLPVVRGF